MKRMVARSDAASVISFRHHPATVLAGKSSGNIPGTFADLHRYRASFPVAWSQMIRAHFRSPVHAAAFFDCDAATARHWFEGTNAPSGAFVAHAVAAIPGALAMLRAA